MRQVSVLLACGALVVAVACFAMIALRPPAAPTPMVAAAAPVPESRPVLDPRVHELADVIGNKSELSEADANTLIGSYLGEPDLVVQRWALVVAGDRLRHATMNAAVRSQLEAMILQAMADHNWRVRRCAVAAIDGSPLANRADVRDRIQELLEDPQPEVVARVKLALGMMPPSEGGSGK